MLRSDRRIAIIGAGPAGIAAAVQLARYELKTWLFEKNVIGGLARNAHWIENYPGFPEGISGLTLAKHLRAHLRKWNVGVKMERVHRLVKKNRKYFIHARRIYCADSVIIASGTTSVMPGIDVARFSDKIFFEIEPLKNCQRKNIVIVGAGDAAYDYALHLGRKNRVLIVNRSAHTRALSLLIRRARRMVNIRIMNDTIIKEIGPAHNGLYVIGLKRDRKSLIRCDYLIYAIGRMPALDFLSPALKKKFPGGDRTMFFVGDVKNGSTRQVAIAVGDGVKAAMEIGTRQTLPR